MASTTADMLKTSIHTRAPRVSCCQSPRCPQPTMPRCPEWVKELFDQPPPSLSVGLWIGDVLPLFLVKINRVNSNCNLSNPLLSLYLSAITQCSWTVVAVTFVCPAHFPSSQFLFTVGCAGSLLCTRAVWRVFAGYAGFSPWWLLPLQGTGSERTCFSSCGAWA